MEPLVSPEEMAAADEAAISSGIPAEILMERAGRAVARAAIGVAGGRYGKRALVVCGKGNNGGDGFVAARRLLAEGLGVTCVLVSDREGITGPAAHHLGALRRAGAVVRRFDPAAPPGSFDVVVDALFGTGFHGAPSGDAAKAIEMMSVAGPIVAADIPSGINGMTGAIESCAVDARITVAIERQKLGTALAPGFSKAGRVIVAPVGISVPAADVHLATADDVTRVLPKRTAMSHKGSTGAVALLAGSTEMPGAAVLTARAADRTGAGYVRLGTTSFTRRVAAIRLPEALVADLGDDWTEESWGHFGSAVARSDALAIGPGLGQSGGARSLVLAALADAECPVLVDADGLNVIAMSTDALRSRAAPSVITPHAGEMGRLLDVDTRTVVADPLKAAQRAAEQFGCVVLLKGPRTVVTCPTGKSVITASGGPMLATAGSGDVLSGVITALMAAGVEPFEAAWVGAHIHGRAGEIAASDQGMSGLVAWDIAEAVPMAIATP